MNNDLISREALKKAFEKVYPLSTNEMGGIVNKRIYEIIDNAPTVEPHYVSDLPDDVVKTLQTLAIDYSDDIAIFERKRPQGKWYYNYQNGWHCSICHEPVKDMPTVMGKANFDFCPNCGAKMKGGAEE